MLRTPTAEARPDRGDAGGSDAEGGEPARGDGQDGGEAARQVKGEEIIIPDSVSRVNTSFL